MGILKKPERWKSKYALNTEGKGSVFADALKEVIEEVLKRAASDNAEKAYASKLAEAIKAKRRQLHLATVDPSIVKRILDEVGATNYDANVRAKRIKYDRFVDGWHPVLASIKVEVDKMPKTTLQERIAKAVRMITLEAQNKGKWRR